MAEYSDFSLQMAADVVGLADERGSFEVVHLLPQSVSHQRPFIGTGDHGLPLLIGVSCSVTGAAGVDSAWVVT